MKLLLLKGLTSEFMDTHVIYANIRKCSFCEEKNVQIQNIDFIHESNIFLLHEKELPQYFRRIKRKKEEYLTSRYIIKSLVARELNINYQDIYVLDNIVDGMSGSPKLYIDNELSNYSISISHDRGICFVGFAQNDIGVDIVVNRKIVSDSSVLGECLENVENDFPVDCFIWAIKESFTKALGIGLRYGINSVEISRIDLDNGTMELHLLKTALLHAMCFSSICFTYEITEQATYVMCNLIR